MEVAAREDAQFDVLVGHAESVDVPCSAPDGEGAVEFHAGDVAEQGAVLEAAAAQVEQADELRAHGLHHRVG
ncbi:hypothetical protein [Streptomyces sp. NPDC001312]|uniref:hypothetical protein n=1 Tax=Streptomyces sp. NPDC001312 TaxID=3364561 RepID=UPI0036993D75